MYALAPNLGGNKALLAIASPFPQNLGLRGAIVRKVKALSFTILCSKIA